MKNFKYILIGLIMGLFIAGLSYAATLLFVSQIRTGDFSPNSLLATGTSTTALLVATSSITVSSIRATSTTLTSAFESSVGVGTTSPGRELAVSSTATTSLFIDGTGGTQGGCIIMRNATGTAYTYITAEYGVLRISTNSCEQ